MKPNSSVFQPCCVLALTRLSYCTLQCIWSIKLILSLPFLIHMVQVFVIRQLSVEMILFPCYSSALFCHMLCLIVADWSIEEQHFCSFCVCYFWWKRSCRSTLHVLACTCVFSQSSRSINNLLAHDQNASPVLPPPPVSYRLRKWVFVNVFQKSYLEVFCAAPWKFSLLKGTFCTRQKR